MDRFSDSIVQFYDKLSSWETEIVRDTGITLPQMHVIEVIGSYGPLRMKDLAEKLGVVMGTLSVMVKRLVKLELVIREPNPEDSRSYLLALTTAGEERYREHHNHHITLAEEITAHLEEGERELFQRLLEKVITSF